MNRGLFALFTTVTALALGACVVKGGDGDDGFNDDGIAGSGGTGGTTGGSGGVGGTGGDGGVGGTGGTTGGAGGTGGSAGECSVPDDCDLPLRDCTIATCEGGVCGSANLEEGAACTLASGDGVCDGAGSCVECTSSSDCGTNEVCNVDFECVPDELTGVCADNFCQVEAASASCFECIQDAGSFGGPCEDEYEDCATDTECLAFFMGTGGDFNDPEVQALGDCICTSGVCVD